MTLADTRKKLVKLAFQQEDDDLISNDLRVRDVKEVYQLIKDSNIIRSKNIIENKTSVKFDFYTLAELENSLDFVHKRVSSIKENIEVEKLHKSGEVFNWTKVKKVFEKRKVFKTFPNFKWMEFKRLVKNPPTEIDGVKFDRFVVRKFVIGIMQMIGNNMDLWIMNTGSEGSGKSCFSSQQVLFFYTFLKRVGLIDYEYNVKKLVRGSLEDLMSYLGDLPSDSFFNISILDEAEDLDRLNYRDDVNKRFKSDMRRNRKNLNIVILNTPQIGEIDTSVTLARINFIFACHMDYYNETGLLNKGIAKMVIIPRTSKTYSKYHQKELFRIDIKNTLSKQFEKKTDYYKDIPDNIIVHKPRFYEKWGFNPDEYDKYIKKENKEKKFADGIKMTKDQMYILYRYAPKLKNWYDKLEKKNIEVDSKPYNTLRIFLKKIGNMFNKNPELLAEMENRWRYK